MECGICGDEASVSCASCINRFCDRCTVNCHECKLAFCLTCSNDCDSCGTHVCRSCTLTLEICNCCKREFEPTNNCVSCVANSWLKLQLSPRCDECQQFCKPNESCNVQSIIKAQTTCPICLDEFKGDNVFQYCGVHMVCKDCDADLNHDKGCPICRKGKSP